MSIARCLWRVFFFYLCGTLDNGKTLIGNIWDFKN